jgi:hypothetical protein
MITAFLRSSCLATYRLAVAPALIIPMGSSISISGGWVLSSVQTASPPEALAWIGVVGGVFGIISVLITITAAWRNRRRIDLRVISAGCYYQLWTESDVEGAYMPAPGQRSFCIPGSCRRFFSVLEFSVHNGFPFDVSIGRFRIDSWMYGASYTPAMYAPERQYEVFDLYTQEPANLSAFSRIPPHGSRGLRVEIFEDTAGPGWESSHSRYVLDVPKQYRIEFVTDVKPLLRKQIKLHRTRLADLINSGFVHRWGDLIGDTTWNTAGAAVPQGLKDPNLEYDWKTGSWPGKFVLHWRYQNLLNSSGLVTRLREWKARRERSRW